MGRRTFVPLLASTIVTWSIVSSGCASPQAAAAPAYRPAPAPAVVTPAPPVQAQGVELRVPNKKDTLKFGVIGDNGSGERPQYDVAAQMVKYREVFPFDFVIMLGDNMYGSQNPRDFDAKFATPYKPLTDAGVKFYATLGNHDNQENRFYKGFNMDGERYYTYEKKNVRFFVLDSDYLDQKQREWIERQLQDSKADWKIAYFHHPLYSSAKAHGSQVDLQLILEPLFVKYGVNVVFSGHDHVYERINPQKGIYYFVEGSSGQLRPGDLRKTPMTAVGFDRNQTFMIVEIDDDNLYFQAVTRTGETVDSGVLKQQEKPKPVGTAGQKP
jgi:predicted phosphodiesterase